MNNDLKTLMDHLSEPPAANAEGLRTVCSLCSCNCGLSVDVKDDAIAKVRGDEDNVYSRGYLCNKGITIDKYVDHAQRVTEPLRRKPDGTFEVIEWETALREIGTKLKNIRDEHSPNAIGLVGIGGQGNHMDIMYGLAFLGLVGTPRWYNAYAQEKTQHHLVSQQMYDAPPGALMGGDVENADFILMTGTNPRVSNRFQRSSEVVTELGKNESKFVVVMDPRETETTRIADVHVRIRPGTDSYFFLAMLKTILDESLVSTAFVEGRTVGFDEVLEAMAGVDVAEMSARCGVPIETIQDVARRYAKANAATIMYDLAVEQIPFLSLLSYLFQVLSVVTDNIGKPGGMVFVHGTLPPERDPNRHTVEPPRALASGIPAIKALTHVAGMYSPTLVPEEIMVDHPERIRALVVEGANPILSYSDASKWREAREHLELMVVVEPAMTETARLADYVLPTPTGYEKWEVSRFAKGFPNIYHLVRKPILSRRGNSLPEGEIYVALLKEMGLIPEVPQELSALAPDALTPEGSAPFLMTMMGAIADKSPAVAITWLHELIGPHLPDPSLSTIWLDCFQNAMGRPDAVIRALGDEWSGKDPISLGNELFHRILSSPSGVEVARTDPGTNLQDNLGWDDGKIRLAPQLFIDEIHRCIATRPRTDDEFPLVLSSGLRTSWTANTIQRDPAWRKGKGRQCNLHVSTEDAEHLGIKDGVRVRISTNRGWAEIPAEIDKNLISGHVWIPNGYGMVTGDGTKGEMGEAVGVNCNELSDAQDRDPLTGIPHHKYTLCKVELAAQQPDEKEAIRDAVHA